MPGFVNAPRRFQLEQLEDRLTPSGTPAVDLTTHGTLGYANNAIFRQYDAQPTGTGVINSFVRLQAQGAKSVVEQGINTDGPLQFDENKSRQFTHSLRLGGVPEVNVGGVRYREFLLDINQKANQPYLSLDELRLFVGDSGSLGYNTTSHSLSNGNTAVYDLGDGNWVKLNVRLNQGSGKGDMLLYVPSSNFGAAGPESFVYLYSKFGVNFTANAGFEEWAVASEPLAVNTGSISGTVLDCFGQPVVDVVLFLDANQNNFLDSDEVYTVTKFDGSYAFTNLAVGMTSYRVYEIVPDGYHAVTQHVVDVDLGSDFDFAVILDFVTCIGDGDDDPPAS